MPAKTENLFNDRVVNDTTMQRRKRFMASSALRITVLLGLLSACTPIQPLPSQSTQNGSTKTATPTLQVAPSQIITQENQMGINLPSNPIVVQAMKDLGKRLNLSLEQIVVISSEAVTWPDSGLGCPKPGMVYTQVMVDGMRIILSAADKTYTYHSGGSRGVFLCENPQ